MSQNLLSAAVVICALRVNPFEISMKIIDKKVYFVVCLWLPFKNSKQKVHTLLHHIWLEISTMLKG